MNIEASWQFEASRESSEFFKSVKKEAFREVVKACYWKTVEVQKFACEGNLRKQGCARGVWIKKEDTGPKDRKVKVECQILFTQGNAEKVL